MANPTEVAAQSALKHVMKYLKRNYRTKDLDWVKGCDWQLNPALKLSTIEMAHRPGGHDEKNVADKVKKIEAGKQPKPIVVVKAGRKHVIADGYTRTDALKQTGHTSTGAWVGTPSPTDTDWPQKIRTMQYRVRNHKVPRDIEGDDAHV